MKAKVTVCIAVSLFMTLTAFAREGDLKISVTIDPSLSWNGASGSIRSAGSRGSFDLAVRAENYFRERYAFYIGASYNRLAGKFRNVSGATIPFKSENLSLGVNEIAAYSIQYLTIPVGLKLDTPHYRRLVFYFQSGLLPGIKTGSHLTTTDTDGSMTRDLNLMTCGLELSVGGMYAMGRDSFIRTGLVFKRFFVDAFSASGLELLSSSIGLQLGFVF